MSDYKNIVVHDTQSELRMAIGNAVSVRKDSELPYIFWLKDEVDSPEIPHAVASEFVAKALAEGNTSGDPSIGPQGPQGAVGPTGPSGKDGINGKDGAVGPTGAQGVTGPQGAPGKDGVAGLQGITGAQGPAGVNGIQGLQGVTGPQGEPGKDGKNVDSSELESLKSRVAVLELIVKQLQTPSTKTEAEVSEDGTITGTAENNIVSSKSIKGNVTLTGTTNEVSNVTVDADNVKLTLNAK